MIIANSWLTSNEVYWLRFDIIYDGARLLNASNREFEECMHEGLEIRLTNFGSELLCYSPSGYPYSISDHIQSTPYSFVSASVTGMACSLNCDHCNGRLLGGMHPTLRPEELFRLAMEVKLHGGTGLLVSGGSDRQGHVPLLQFGEVLKRIHNELGLRLVVHTGILNEETADVLQSAQIDAAMLDIIGHDDVAKRIYHLENGPQRMEHSLELLAEREIPTVPHVLVGLDHGRVSSELKALDMIASHDPAAVVIIVLRPIRHTMMETVSPPSPTVVARILTIARLGLPRTPVLLGCARPLGQHKIESDCLAIRSGANGIAYISQEGVNLARSLGLVPRFIDVCCSLAYLHVHPALGQNT